MVVIGLGSNVGDRLSFLQRAIAALRPVLRQMQASRVYESKALLPKDATPDMDMPFLNMAVRGECSLAPQELLQRLKTIEQELGRVQRCIWGPREIDMDILAMDGLVLQSEALNVPHKALPERDFALVPFADVAPGWVHPLAGKTAAELVKEKKFGAALRDTGLEVHV